MSVVVAEGVVEVTADAKGVPGQIGKDIEKNGKPVEDAGGVLGGKLSSGIKTGLVKVGAVVGTALLAATAAVGIGVGAIITKGVAFESAMQNYTASFTPLLGGADAAKTKLAELSAMGASTPFTLTDLAGASQTLLSFGETATDLMPDLKMLGDISQGNQEKFSGLALVFGQVQSTGRLMGGDVLQMINQGFNPLVEISKMTGESMVDLKKRMEAGKISFDEVKGAMQHATAEGGMFFNAMELGSKTLSGAWSSTQDGADILSGTITGKLTPTLTGVLDLGINPLLGGLVDLINGTAGAGDAVQEASDAMLGQLDLLGPVVTDIAGKLGTVFEAVGPALSAAAGILVKSLSSILPALVGVAGQLITAIVGALIANAGQLVTAVIPMVMILVTGLVNQIPALIQVGLDMLLALVGGITSSLPMVIPAVVTAVVGAIATLFNPGNLTALLDAGLQLIMGLATGIIAALPGLIAALPSIIIGIIDFLINAIPTLIDAGLQLFLSLVGALPDIITGIVDAIPQIILGLITAVLGAIPQLVTGGIKLFMGLIGALPQIIVSLVSAMPQIIQGIVGAFTDPATISMLAAAGGDMIKGLWKGISDIAGWLWGKVSGFMGGLVNNIKGFFGIHSPSTLFENEIGAMLGEGMAIGITDSADLVAAAAGGLMDAARKGVGGSIGITVDGGPGDGFGTPPGPFGGGGLSGGGGPPSSLVGGGDTIVIERVVIDAQNVKDFTDVVDMVKALPQVARSGKSKRVGV